MKQPIRMVLRLSGGRFFRRFRGKRLETAWCWAGAQSFWWGEDVSHIERRLEARGETAGRVLIGILAEDGSNESCGRRTDKAGGSAPAEPVDGRALPAPSAKEFP